MKSIRKYIADFDTKKALRITNVRILSQIFFFAMFTISVWLTWTSRLGGYPVSRILEFDPLVMVANIPSTGYVYRYLGWGLVIVAVTLLFGRVFCNWICPYGTLHQFVGWLFNIGTGKNRIVANEYLSIYYLTYAILTVFLITPFIDSPPFGPLHPPPPT